MVRTQSPLGEPEEPTVSAAFPPITGLHHVSLTVSDVDRSITWYQDVCGFRLRRRHSSYNLKKALLAHECGIQVVLNGHGTDAISGRFSEFRCGLDHLALAVPDLRALERWLAHLDAAGVEHSGIAVGSTGHLIAFRDPDGIALEFYTV